MTRWLIILFALFMAPAALAEDDSNVWWDLPRLLPFAGSVTGAERAAWQAVESVARQRI